MKGQAIPRRKRTPPPEPVEFASDIQLARRYAVSRGTIWRWTDEGLLPKPLKLGPSCTRWRLTEVVERLEGKA